MPRLLPALALALFIFLPGVFSAEAARPAVPALRVFSAKETGGAERNRAIVAHPGGRIYVGNDRGLLEFDGDAWRAIESVGELAIHALALDGDGRIWFAGVDKFGVLERAENGELAVQFVPIELPEAERRSGIVRRRIVPLGDSVYFLLGTAGAVMRVDAERTVHSIQLPGLALRLNAWFGALYAQLATEAWRIEGDTAQREPGQTYWRGFTEYSIVSTWPRGDDSAWVVTVKGIDEWSNGTSRRVDLSLQALLGSDTITAGCPLGEDAFLLGTGGHGLLIRSASGQVRAHYDRYSGLGTYRVNDVAVDREGTAWAALDTGIACVTDAANARAVAPPVAPAPRFTGTPLMRVFTASQFGVARARAVVVHPDGLVYVGGASVKEFDGATWRSVPGTVDEGIYSLAIDAGGRVFYGAQRGFGLLAPDAKGVLSARPLEGRLEPADRDLSGFSQVVACGHEAYFAPGGRNFVVRIDAAEQLHVIRLPAPPRRILPWGDGVYVQTDQAVYRIANDVAQAVEGELALRGFLVQSILELWPDGAGGAWQIGLRGLLRWQGEKAALVSPAVSTLLGSDVVTAGCDLGDGTFALGTRRNGVLRIDAKGAVLARYDEEHGLGQSSGTVNGFALDAEGGLWVAHEGGASRVQVRSPAALHGAATGLRGTVRAIAEHGGRLFVGTSQGLHARDPQSGRFKVNPVVRPPISHLLSTREGLLLGGLAFRLLRDDGSVELIDNVSFSSLLRLPSDETRLVASLSSGGVRLYRLEQGRWRPDGDMTNVRDALANLTLDREGWLWGLRGGREVVRIDWRNGPKLDAPIERLGAAHGLPDFVAIHQNARLLLLGEELVVASREILLRFDRAAGRFVPETRFAGLGRKDATRMMFPLPDQRVFWMQPWTNRTLGIFRPTAPGAWQLEAEPYTGFEAVITETVFEQRGTGTIWFGGEQLVSFERDVPRFSTPPPDARVRRVTTADKKIIWGGAGPEPATPFAPEQNSALFAFAAPSYRTDADGDVQVQYRSKLDGFDREWSPWSSETQRTYTNLPPGNFAFRVQARGDDYRTGREARFAFRVLPPWWRTWWFLGLASVTGIGGVAGATRWFANRALKRRVALLEAQSAVERERLRLARDLHDEVGSGLGRVILFAGEADRNKGDPAKLESSLTRVRQSAQELVQHAREIVWAVSPQHDTLASVIERLGDYVEETLRSAGIACAVARPAPDKIPPVMLGSEARHSLFLAVKEAVHNAVKYSEAKTAEFRLEIRGNDFVITLRDHGRGFAPGEKRGSGHGMLNIVARAEALGGGAEIASEVGRGTTVTLRVPLVQGGPA